MITWIDRNGTAWPADNPNSPVGFLPGFLDYGDPRPAAKQFDERYKFGGWRPIDGFELVDLATEPKLTFPGDPPLRWLAMSQLRDERLIMFQASMVAIIQLDGTFEVAHLD